MSNKPKKTKSKQVKTKGAPMSNAAPDIAKAASPPPMSNKAQDVTALSGKLDDAPMLQQPERAAAPLGTLSAAESDHSLSASEPTKAQAPASAPKSSSHKKDKPAPADDKPAQPGVLTAEPPQEKPDPFRLPRSAFVGLRKSGGLNFTTREVVFYPDGRVAYDARGVPQKEYTRLRRVMNDGQIVSLRKLLDQTNFWMTEGGGQQNPDAFAYEIAASLNHRSHELEVFDGSIPENIKPLIERLSKFLPE